MASLSLTKLPWYAQLAVFVVASAALAGGFYYFYEMGQQATLGDKEKELASVRERIQRASATARQLPEFRKQVGDLQARIDALKPILPEERDVGDLLRRVQTLATQSNLKINGFRPLAITTHDLHAEWPISLQLEGTYHNLGLFLDKVSKFPRIINVGSLVLAAKDPPTTATIDITCTATTFVLVEKPPEPPPDETKKKGPAKKTPAPAKKA